MKNLILLGLFLSGIAFGDPNEKPQIPSGPGSPIIFANGCAFNLITQACVPSSTGATLSIGAGISGGSPNLMLYEGPTGLLAQDPGFIRDTSTPLNSTNQNSLFNGVGATDHQTDIFIIDDVTSTITVTLSFNGTTDTCASVVTAWNGANPTATVTQTAGLGSDIPDAEDVTFSNGQVIFGTGKVPTPVGGNAYGVSSFITDQSGIFAISAQGDLGEIVGISGLSSIHGVADSSNNNSFLIQGPTSANLFVNSNSDNVGFDVALGQGAYMQYNDLGITTNGNTISWFDNANNFILPTGSTPTTGQVMTVQSVGGGAVHLDFETPSSGGLPSGTQEFQYLKWDTGTSLPAWNRLYVQTEESPFEPNENVALGVRALGIGALNASLAGTYANTAIGTGSLTNLANAPDPSANYSRNTAVGLASGAGIGESYLSDYFGYQVHGQGGTAIENGGAFFGSDLTVGTAASYDIGNTYVGGSPDYPAFSDASITGTFVTGVGASQQLNGSNIISIGSRNAITSSGSNIINLGWGNLLNTAGNASANLAFIGTGMGSSCSTCGNIFAVGFGGPGNLSAATFDALILGGYNVTSGFDNFIFLGGGGITTGDDEVAIGLGAGAVQATGNNNVMIGQNADTLSGGTINGVAIGVGANAGDNAIALGIGSVAQSNTFVAGGNAGFGPITDVWFGSGQVANADYTIHGSEPFFPSPAADTSGGSLTIAAGRGNGNQTGGSLGLASSMAGISGSSQNPLFYFGNWNPNGGTPTLDWGDPFNALPGSWNIHTDYNAGTFTIGNGAFGAIQLSSGGFTLQDASNTPAIDVGVRQLKNNGNNVVVDWGSSNTVKFSTGITYNGGTSGGSGSIFFSTSANMFFMNPSAGNTLTGTLPDATTCANFFAIIKRIDTAGAGVTINTMGGQTIDNVSSTTLAPLQSITVISDGANWWKI